MTISLATTHRLFSRLLLLLYLFLGLADAAQAALIEFPESAPSIRFTVPDGWTNENWDNGNLQFTSTDGKLSFVVLSSKEFSDPKASLMTLAMVLVQGGDYTDLDRPERKTYTTRGGVKLTCMELHCTKGGVPSAIIAMAFTPERGTGCIFLWMEPAGETDAGRQMHALIDSIKPAK